MYAELCRDAPALRHLIVVDGPPDGPPGTLPWAQLLADGEWRVLLEAGDDTTAGGIELGPPTEVVIAEVEDIGRSRFDRRPAACCTSGAGEGRRISDALHGHVSAFSLSVARFN